MLSSPTWRGVGGECEGKEEEPRSRDMRDSRRCVICCEGVSHPDLRFSCAALSLLQGKKKKGGKTNILARKRLPYI